MVISKEPRKCKQKVEDKIIENIMTFNYFGAKVISKADLNEKVTRQTTKAGKVSGCLWETIWKIDTRLRKTKLKHIKQRKIQEQIQKEMKQKIINIKNDSRPNTERQKDKQKRTRRMQNTER